MSKTFKLIPLEKKRPPKQKRIKIDLLALPRILAEEEED
jgi:hypothetical protein